MQWSTSRSPAIRLMLVAGERACALVGSLGNPLDRQTENAQRFGQLNPSINSLQLPSKHAMPSLPRQEPEYHSMLFLLELIGVHWVVVVEQ